MEQIDSQVPSTLDYKYPSSLKSVEYSVAPQFSWLCWLGLHAYHAWVEWGRLPDHEVPKSMEEWRPVQTALQQGRCMRCSKLKIATQ